jgi:hypothetical protein
VTNDPNLRALDIPFTEQELAILAERAAAHRVPVLDFVRWCVLARTTPIETPARPVERRRTR